jgi:hypothetical protein
MSATTFVKEYTTSSTVKRLTTTSEWFKKNRPDLSRKSTEMTFGRKLLIVRLFKRAVRLRMSKENIEDLCNVIVIQRWARRMSKARKFVKEIERVSFLYKDIASIVNRYAYTHVGVGEVWSDVFPFIPPYKAYNPYFRL